MTKLLGKILIVDDEVLIATKIADILRQAYYEPYIALVGEEAVDLLKHQEFDLILLDIEMPTLTGFDVSKIIRKELKLTEIPILFLTAHTNSKYILKAFSVGARDYIYKPFNRKELLARVDTHIKLKRQADHLTSLNHTLALKNQEIQQSISYAKFIQESIFQPLERIEDSIPDYFVFYQPKELVGGDFFWFKKIKNLFYIAAVDCTGHGIPGALMSMMSITVMNQTINSQHVNAPSVLLKKLQKKIEKLLNQRSSIENSNGFDIALCQINLETKVLEYAGANRPLYLMTKNEKSGIPEFVIKKPTPIPIGLHPKDNMDFTLHTLQLKQGDIVYIFSDGYTSQFGGDFNKKIGSKRFRNFLYTIHTLPMQEQKSLLEENFNLWKGDLEQVDDTLVIGLKF